MMAIKSRSLRRVALQTWLYQPVNIFPLVMLRVIFGGLMLLSTVRFVLKGWVAEFYIEPSYHFTYAGFSWVKPLPPAGMYLVFGLMGVFSLFIVLGAVYRLSMGAFFILFTYVELLDKAFYLNHYYFVSLLSFMLIFLPLHRRGSVDVWLRPVLHTRTVPRWTILAVQIQLATVYFFAGVAKINPDWLLEAMPLAIWLPARADFPMVGQFFDRTWLPYAMSWGGMLFDLTIPFWLGWKRTRPAAYLAVIGFHGLTGWLFRIGMFPWIMIGCTLIFFANGHSVPALPEKPTRNYGLFLISGFLFIQLLLPLRHWMYPGNVLWTEEGYRFSWRVMLAEKAGYTTFFVRNPESGKEWVVYPNDMLTPQQTQQMSFQPDMILSFAHYLRDNYRAKGYAEIEVRVEAYVSWNGRASRLLIDPTVDLANEANTLRHKKWILP